MANRARNFGSVAGAYERFRLGYPDELVDEVFAYVGSPIRAALEIGAGTGKATRAFARRGIAVTASEPDAAMLAELRTHALPTVVTTRAAFEELPLTGVYDLVFAAAAMHWTEPLDRWARVAAMLTSNGVFASFGGPIDLDDPDIKEAVRKARAPILTDDGVPSPDGTLRDSHMQWPGTELAASGLFADVRQVVIARRVVVSAADYVGHLSTISAYLQLSSTTRAEVFNRIAAVLPAHVALNADLTLHLARVVSRGKS